MERFAISAQNVKLAVSICKTLRKTQIGHFYIVKSLENSKTVFRPIYKTTALYDITYIRAICLIFFYLAIKTNKCSLSIFYVIS